MLCWGKSARNNFFLVVAAIPRAGDDDDDESAALSFSEKWQVMVFHVVALEVASRRVSRAARAAYVERNCSILNL